MASDSDDVEEQELSESESDVSEEEEDSSDYGSDDESESSFDEMSVGVALELPKRENRGKKYTKLVGEELEKDQQFWGHNTWEEEAVDEDYNCHEDEEQYDSSTDSDFDDPETDEEEGEADESYLMEKRRRKHGAYVDPVLQRNKRTRMAIQKQKAKSISAEKRRPQKHAAEDTVEYNVERSIRETTKKKTEVIMEIERRRDLIRSDISTATTNKKGMAKTKAYTQEELMAMALRTEIENTRSLENLQAWEDEKKRYEDIKKWNYKGNYDIWVCWNSLLSIVAHKATDAYEEEQEIVQVQQPQIEEKPLQLFMFTSGKLPEYYNQVAKDYEEQKTMQKPICAITGQIARYRDPVTGMYYSDAAAYQVIRMHHDDTCNTQMADTLNHLEEMLDELIDTEQLSI